MKAVMHRAVLALVVASLFAAMPSKAEDLRDGGVGAVFVMTNSAERNAIVSFRRNEDGSLERVRTFGTGGRGTGGVTDPLESQGSLALSKDHQLLFAVNGGSGEISVFKVRGTNLFRVDKKASGGAEPNAIAQFGNLVYVLNVGGSSNIVGFRLSTEGTLKQIPNSTRFLTTNNSEAAAIAFAPDGRFLVVTERATNNIDVFEVQGDGTLSPIIVNNSSVPGVFSVAFSPFGAAIVSETGPAGGSNASTISSYAIAEDGTLAPISTGVPTLGNANCWNVVTPNGQFVYASNAGSSSIAGFSIDPSGLLTPVGPTVVGTNPSGSTNLDLAISGDGKFLYSLNSGTGTIGVFGVQKDGSLLNLGQITGLSANAGLNGIAAF